MNWIITYLKSLTKHTDHLDDYMLRYGLNQRSRIGYQVWIHEILRSDNFEELHDHPWNFISIILNGTYLEVSEKSPHSRNHVIKKFGPGSIIFRRAEFRHKLILPIGPVTTLFICTPKFREWGIWREMKFIPSKELFPNQ